MATQSADAVLTGRGVKKKTGRSGYFFWTSVVLLAIVLAGFAPTFYLRAFFDTAPIPFYLYAHGVVLSAWFIWLVVQTRLVRTGKTPTHRRMGWVGAAIAAVVVIGGPMASLGVVGRLREAGLDFDSDMGTFPGGVPGTSMLDFASQTVWPNLMMAAVFAVLFVAAVLLRKRPEYHKRFMLIASMELVLPALLRIARWSIFGTGGSMLIPIGALALILSVSVHDVVTRRKPHPATLIGTVLFVGGLIAAAAIARTSFGLDFVRALG